MSKPKGKRHIDVMPSSTTKDLPEHRQNVIDAIIRVGWFPLTMEYEVGKPDEEAISYSLRLVDEAEVYILILGARYGYVPKMKNGEFGAALLGWGTMGADFGTRSLLATIDPAKGWGTWNWGKYSNKAVDELLHTALGSTDPATRDANARDAMTLAL